jgi:hypothetical protein
MRSVSGRTEAARAITAARVWSARSPANNIAMPVKDSPATTAANTVIRPPTEAGIRSRMPKSLIAGDARLWT